MKAKTMVLGCLAGVVILAIGYEYGQTQLVSARAEVVAGPKANEPALNIGVVSIKRALRDCKATVIYREKAIAENGEMDIKEEKLAKEVQALAAGLKAFQPNSSDYLARYLELLQKQAELKALQEFNPRQRISRELLWTQDLYEKILQITKELAAEKALDLVLGVDEPEFPIQRYEELVMTISTHKVLYGDGCVDLTDEVVARLDKK